MSDLDSINSEQRLYVKHCGSGYTCLGFDRAEKIQAGVAEWLRRPDLAPKSEDKGTVRGYERYSAAMEAGAQHYSTTGERCPIDLTPQLRGLEGRRVEVVDCYGEKRRFIVGRSTGWMPCHIEIARRTSSGGGAVTGAPFKSVEVIR